MEKNSSFEPENLSEGDSFLRDVKNSVESKRVEWISELRSRIEEQKSLVQEAKKEFVAAQKELEVTERRPWYKKMLNFDFVADITLLDKQEEVEKKKKVFQNLDGRLVKLQGELEDAIKGY